MGEGEKQAIKFLVVTTENPSPKCCGTQRCLTILASGVLVMGRARASGRDGSEPVVLAEEKSYFSGM